MAITWEKRECEPGRTTDLYLVDGVYVSDAPDFAETSYRYIIRFYGAPQMMASTREDVERAIKSYRKTHPR